MFYLILQIIFFYLNLSLCSSSSLYKPDDPFWELDSTNFRRIVFDKDNAWVIEFYNSWCGHCIRYVPVWREFANDVRSWKNVVRVAVVNCAESKNVKLCRDYNVASYPSIKLFGTFIKEGEVGESVTGDRDVSSLQNTIIRYLESRPSETVPPSWPDLRSFNDTNIKSLVGGVPKTADAIYLFFEAPGSYVGRKIILDVSSQRNVTIRRVLDTNIALLEDLNLKNEDLQLPFLLKVSRNGDIRSRMRFPIGANESYFRNQVYENIVGKSLKNFDNLNPDDDKKDDTSLQAKGVYMTDLENAVRYLLMQEVAIHNDIDGAKLEALKSFLSVLAKYFPGQIFVTGFLTKLNEWVSNQGSLTGEAFADYMDALQSETEYLPEMQDWVACKGSESKYRGYPCSLWTLFHTLTVEAYNTYDESGTKDDSVKILLAIRRYVKYFFTCRDCSENFQKESENVMNEAHNASETVLWLWNTHNHVNQRLAGDATEDPKSPKIQFPSVKMCPKCRIVDSDDGLEWDKSIVLRFLLHFYGKDNIKSSKEATAVTTRLLSPQHAMDNSSRDRRSLSAMPTLLMLLCHSTYHHLTRWL